METVLTVTVVGGGIIGGSIAWRLAQGGIRVVVHEAGAWGGEASWAGAGMLAPGGEVDSGKGWRGLAARGLDLYGDFVRELEAESGECIDFRISGAVEPAREGAEAAALRERAAVQAALGIPSQAVSAADAGTLAPGLAWQRFAEARYYPRDGQVNPRDIMRALRVAIERRGGEIRERSRVEGVDLRGPEVEAAGTRAQAAVLAAGTWCGSIAVNGAPPLKASIPVRGHLTGYYLEPGLLRPLVRHDHTYLLQRSNGFLIAGATEERAGFDREIDGAAVSALTAKARALFPPLPAAGPAEVWNGFRPGTESLEPEVGRVPGTPVWRAYGHYRNGILLAPVTAEIVAGDIIASLGTGR